MDASENAQAVDVSTYVHIELKNTTKFFMEMYQGGKPPSVATRRAFQLSSVLSSERQGAVDVLLSDTDAGDELYGLFPYRLTLNFRKTGGEYGQVDLRLVVRNLLPGDQLVVRGSDGVVPAHLIINIQNRMGWNKVLDTNIGNQPQYFDLNWKTP